MQISEQPTPSQWRLLPFHLGAAIGPMGGGILPVLFVILMGAFDVDRATLSLAVPAYMIPYAVVQLISGSVSDLTSRRFSILLGFGSFGTATILAGLSPNFEFFLATQVLQGSANAFTTPLLMATLGDVVPGKGMSRTIGFFSTANLAGSMLAPLLGGALGDISWRLAYFFFGLLSWLIAIWYVVWFRHYDAVVPLRRRGASLRGDVRAIVSALGFQIVLLMSLSFLANTSIRGPIYLFADYLHQGWGVGAREAGMILATYGLAGLLVGPFAGDLIERYGTSRSIAVAIVGSAAALGLMGLAPSPALFAAANFGLGVFGIFAWTGLNTLAVRFVPEHRGTTASLFGSARFFASGVSPLWYTPLYQAIGPASIFAVGGALALVLLAPLAALHGKIVQLHAPQSGKPATD